MKYRDVEITIPELAKVCGLHYSTLSMRIKAGWHVEAACIAKPSDRVSAKTSTAFAKFNKDKCDAIYLKLVTKPVKRSKEQIIEQILELLAEL